MGKLYVKIKLSLYTCLGTVYLKETLCIIQIYVIPNNCDTTITENFLDFPIIWPQNYITENIPEFLLVCWKLSAFFLCNYSFHGRKTGPLLVFSSTDISKSVLQKEKILSCYYDLQIDFKWYNITAVH